MAYLGSMFGLRILEALQQEIIAYDVQISLNSRRTLTRLIKLKGLEIELLIYAAFIFLAKF
jgi:hypothetical protein